MIRAMRLSLLLLVLAASVLPGSTWAGMTGTGHRNMFMVRMYTSEVPSAVVEEGRYVRIGVILPPMSKVLKVEAYMDEVDHGRSVDGWADCNLETGTCELDGVRVDGLSRVNTERDVQILANFWNYHDEKPRFAKLKVSFLPTGNPRKTYNPKYCWLRTKCGYAGWMDAAYDEEAPVQGGG